MAIASVAVKSSCLWSKTIFITTTTRDTREDSECWHQLRSTIHIFSQHNYLPHPHHNSTNTGSGNGVKWQYAGRRPGSTWRSDTDYPYPHQRAWIHACWLPSGEEIILFVSGEAWDTSFIADSVKQCLLSTKNNQQHFCYWLPKSFDFSLSSWRVAVQTAIASFIIL